MRRKVFYWILVVLWMTLIFYLSHQPASKSNELSIGVTEKITGIVGKTNLNIEQNIRNFNRIIRKNAHFFAYLILGILTFNGLKDSKITGGRGFIIALIICILYAISDEIHQLFIPGRSGQVMDVVIDGMGSLVGITLHQMSNKIKTN